MGMLQHRQFTNIELDLKGEDMEQHEAIIHSHEMSLEMEREKRLKDKEVLAKYYDGEINRLELLYECALLRISDLEINENILHQEVSKLRTIIIGLLAVNTVVLIGLVSIIAYTTILGI